MNLVPWINRNPTFTRIRWIGNWYGQGRVTTYLLTLKKSPNLSHRLKCQFEKYPNSKV